MKLNGNFMQSSILAAALIAPLLLAAPAGAADGKSKFSNAQRLGYLGETSKSALARGVLSRLQNTTTAPTLSSPTDRIVFWHSVLLDSIALDHTPDPDTGVVDFVQGGPGRTSRTLAMTQIAVFDAVNAFKLRYNPYNGIGKVKSSSANVDAAIAYAAYGVLSALYPDQIDRLDSLLASDIAQIVDTPKKIAAGRKVGEQSAAAMLARRASDNSTDPEPQFGEGGRIADGTTTYYNTPVNGGTALTLEWEPDPNTPPSAPEATLALGAYWGGVTPFVLASGNQFRIGPPPAPGSAAFVAAYDEVASIGGSPANANTPSASTPETRFIGNFWGYDAVPLLGTPPRLYNQIAIQVGLAQGLNEPDDLARYLAMVNAVIGDAGIAAWDSKYFYNYWRPVTGVRRDDGVAETTTDPTWDPVGVSVINTTAAIRPTPPFPAYPSGHATFGASSMEILRSFFGDSTAFTFVSDEYNGEGSDPFTPGTPRPLVPVRFDNFTDAQLENGVSRIYNGVHWNYDNLGGQGLGVSISQYMLNNVAAFQPKH